MDDPRFKGKELIYEWIPKVGGRWVSRLKKRNYNKKDYEMITMLNLFKSHYGDGGVNAAWLLGSSLNLIDGGRHYQITLNKISENDFMDILIKSPNDIWIGGSCINLDVENKNIYSPKIDNGVDHSSTMIQYGDGSLCQKLTKVIKTELLNMQKNGMDTFDSMIQYIEDNYDKNMISSYKETNYDFNKIKSLEKMIDDLKKNNL